MFFREILVFSFMSRELSEKDKLRMYWEAVKQKTIEKYGAINDSTLLDFGKEEGRTFTYESFKRQLEGCLCVCL